MHVKGLTAASIISPYVMLSQQHSLWCFSWWNAEACPFGFVWTTSLLLLQSFVGQEWFLRMKIFLAYLNYVVVFLLFCFVFWISHEHLWVLWRNPGVASWLDLCFGCLFFLFFFFWKSHEKTTIKHYFCRRKYWYSPFHEEENRQRYSRNQVKLYTVLSVMYKYN